MTVAVIAALSYLLGSIPFGLIVSLSRGIDVRKAGSGNIGATNVFRTVGKPWGILTFILDFLKGFVATAFIPVLAAHICGTGCPQWAGLVGGGCAIAGHTWPVFIGFRGGKGVATGAGMLAALSPWTALVAVGAWIVMLLATRYVSVASICAALTLCVLSWIPPFRAGTATSIVFTILAIAVIARHRSNIQRLIKGTESRFAFTKAQKQRESSGSAR